MRIFLAEVPLFNEHLMTEHPKEEVREIDVKYILVNPFQPRHQFDEENLQELAASILSVGIIHPPLVRPNAERPGYYEIISGERRFRAAQIAGFNKIPVLIRHTSNALSAQAALIENIQRVDLNPIDIAQTLRRLSIELHLNQEELAKRIGKKRSTVANYLRLLTLPTIIQEKVIQGMISMGHAKAILSIEGVDQQIKLFEQILLGQWNVRQSEEAAQKIAALANPKPKKAENPQDVHIQDLIDKLQHKLGTKVTVQTVGNSGRISFDYYSLDDLDRLLLFFGVDAEK